MGEIAKSLSDDHKAKIDLITRRLMDRRKRVREQAAMELAALGPDYREAVVRLANQKCNSWQERRALWAIATLIACNGVVQIFVMTSHASLWPKLFRGIVLGLPLGFAAMWTVHTLMVNSVKLNRLVPAMCEISDIRSIDALLGACYMCNKSDRQRIEKTLSDLIGNNHRAAWNALTPNSRTDLNRFVTSGNGVRFQNAATIEAVLRLFAACGDEPELKTARKLAHNAKRPEVRQAAAKCLAELRSKLGVVVSNDSLLLRPSHSTNNESLVRPANGITSDTSTNLLRPEPERIETVSLRIDGSVDG